MAPFSSLRRLRPPLERAAVDVWPLAKRNSTCLSGSVNALPATCTPSTPPSPRSKASDTKHMRRVVSLNSKAASCMVLSTAAAQSSTALTTTTSSSSPSPPCSQPLPSPSLSPSPSPSQPSSPPRDALHRARLVERHLKATLRADAARQTLHGLVRVPWALGMRQRRLLALKGRELSCVDVGGARTFWKVGLEGARMRIQLPQCRIVLSKLQGARVLQFWAPDQLAARRWAAALLRASALVPLERNRWL
eukprot:gb/GEZJ01007229.1/.p1 GENE.gb/GEZJ01007229.1/~~gb/GEZJ01007229.1/.p1  ORF type:complete len:277 (-),score=30.18 gb/GEZJ01007229.1/:252-998(-)